MIRTMQKALAAVTGSVVVLLFSAASASAQSVEFSSSLNPVGSGARATGMGGAFIGVADDATAASWNPAGLIQLEKPEISTVYADFRREQAYGLHLLPPALRQAQPGISTDNVMGADGVNFASFAYPFTLCGRGGSSCRDMVFSLSYQRMYEMAKNIDVLYIEEVNVPPPNSFIKNFPIHYSQEGSLYAFSPALAVQVVPSLSVGATLNYWKDYAGRNGWDTSYVALGRGEYIIPAIPLVMHYTDDQFINTTYDFQGFNTNLGLLWNPLASVTIGAVYKTPFSADLRKASSYYDHTTMDGVTQSEDYLTSIEYLTMRMPPSYGAGIQYRPSDRLIFALDAYRTQWSRFVLRLGNGEERNPVTGGPMVDGALKTILKDTTQYRFGTEYLFIGNNRVTALRGGLFSDPEPAVSRVERFYGLTLGAGFSTQRFSLDASWQLRQGKDLTTDFGLPMIGTMDVKQRTTMVSMIVYF